MQIWIILAALTIARTAMAFQFQSVPALITPISEATGMGFGAIGLLAGIYFIPGVVTAMLGGWAGQVIGDIRTALFGLLLMGLAGLAGAYLQGAEIQMIARFLAGIGAVAVNVMGTKMVGDWFQGRRDLPWGMAIWVSSWPIGLALAMLVLPQIADAMAYQHALALPALLSLGSFVFLALVWRAPEKDQTAAQPSERDRLQRKEVILILLAGLIWGIYNVAFVAAISWSPGRLELAGLSQVEAAAIGSLIGWVAIFSLAAGGWLAVRMLRPDHVALGSFVLSALGLLLLSVDGLAAAGLPLLLLLGIVIGPAASMIMTLPVVATRPSVRAFGMGLFMAIYYGLMGIAPSGLGILRDEFGSIAPLLAAAGAMVLCFGLWVIFRQVQAAIGREG